MLIVLAVAVTTSSCSKPQEPRRQGALRTPVQILVDPAPYSSAEEANDAASSIQWDADQQRPAAVTMSWAALELKRWLTRSGLHASITTPQAYGSGGHSIALVLLATPDPSLGDQGFRIGTRGLVTQITANDRVGVLYGSYVLLERLGFRWFDPANEIVPTTVDLATLSRLDVTELPATKYRGFWVPSHGDALDEPFAIWMARNRLNLGGQGPPSLRRKLGVYSWNGGHDIVQQELGHPEVFAQHPAWFGLIRGIRQAIDATASQYINPAYASPELADFIASRLIARLENGDLKNVDILALWPSDGFGTWDESPEARSLGNNTDTLLVFYSRILQQFEQARSGGTLSRPVALSGISYNETWQPPQDPNHFVALARPDYIHVYYDPERSFGLPITEQLPARSANRRFVDNITLWKSLGPVPFGVTEYFNNSSYSAVAVTDHPSLIENYRFEMRGTGSVLYAYMHPLDRHVGPRQLTNWLVAKVAWKGGDVTDMDAHAWLNDFFLSQFGGQSDAMRQVFDDLAQATSNAREMFIRNSLFDLLYAQHHRKPVAFTVDEVSSFLDGYLRGGVQSIPPSRFNTGGPEKADFVGVNESVLILSSLESRVHDIGTRHSLSETTKNEVRSLAEWIGATHKRYLSLQLAVRYYRGKNLPTSFPQDAAALLDTRDKLEALRADLSHSPLTADTISPLIDQRDMYLPVEKMDFQAA
jgi:hypothetical protein